MDTAQRAAFGELLRRYRRVAGLTQEELAARSGVGVRSITDLERAVAHTARRDTLRRLAAALGLAGEAAAAFEALARNRSTTLAPLTAPSPHAVHAPTLPASPTPLIGRDAVVATAVDFLSRATTRLLTLTGPGGVGKTCLAVRVAEELRDRFADKVVFVPLAPLNAHHLVILAVARALGAREGAVELPPESVATYLRERELLLVLDNFEHVAEAAPLVAELLAGCPRLRVLVTSRAAVHVRGEHELAVAPLAVPAPPAAGRVRAVAEVAAFPAAALFVERAGAVRSDFTLTPVNLEAVVEICRRLDGLPLALELAAARVRLLLPGELLARLEHRLPLLTGGARDLPERQRTLRATIAWSYDLLSAGEQAVFRRLCVFAGGWTLDAAVAVCAAGAGLGVDVLDWLGALIEKSLLHRAPAVPATRGARDEPRYGMLETVREYAREQLEAHDEEGQARARHAAYYLALAERAEPRLVGPEHAAWLARLEREGDNLRAALRWARDTGAVELGLRMAGALGQFWHARGHVSEASAAYTALLAHEGASAVAMEVRAKALWGASVMATIQLEHARATAFAEDILTLPLAPEYQHYACIALIVLGYAARQQGETGRALALLERGVDLARRLGHTWSIAQTLNCLAIALIDRGDRGDYERAEALCEESLAMARDIGEAYGVALLLATLGRAAHRQGDEDRAARRYRESLNLYHDAGVTLHLAECLWGLAAVRAARGHPEDAARLLGAAAVMRETTGSPVSPFDRADYERDLDAVRAALGEEAFAAAWATGKTLSLEQAIADAYEEPAQG